MLKGEHQLGLPSLQLFIPEDTAVVPVIVFKGIQTFLRNILHPPSGSR
jgi:hypothetical protein